MKKIRNKKYKVIRQQLKWNKYKSIYSLLKELAHYSKNLYNQALYIVRQEFFKDKKERKYKNYYEVNKELIGTENYSLLQAGCSQQTLKMVDEAFQSFFALCKKKIKCRIPKYLHKDGFFKVCDPEGMKHINLIGNKLYWTIPMSKRLLKKYNLGVNNKNRPKIQMPNILKDKKIQQIWIVPKHKGNYFEVQYVYDNTLNFINTNNKNLNQDQTDQLKQQKYLSIDLGVNNLCTCATSDLKSFIIDGKRIKSWNNWYNKRISILQTLASKDKSAPKFTRQMYNITRKRNNRINDYIHKACKYIINYCLYNQINNIILGYNKGFKQNVNLGKKANQQFIGIPFYKLKENLTYLCEDNKINLVIQEESYTSQANFLNKDFIPTYGVNDKLAKFTGKRIERGLYESTVNDKKLRINADLNGSLNILRKYFQSESKVVEEYNLYKKLYDILYTRGVLITPLRINLFKKLTY